MPERLATRISDDLEYRLARRKIDKPADRN
jgi:hypothetical protein